MRNTADSVIPRDFAVSKHERHHGYLMPIVRRRLASLTPGARVIDLGCGSGYVTGQIANWGYEVTGVDASESGIAAARTTWPNVRFLAASVTDPAIVATLGEGVFDAIVAMEVIEHLYSPARFFEICHSLLTPGGVFIVTTPYHGYLKNLGLAITGKFEKHLQPGSEGGHIKFWSKATLTPVLDRHGFKLAHFDGAGRFAMFWKSMVLTCVRQPH